MKERLCYYTSFFIKTNIWQNNLGKEKQTIDRKPLYLFMHTWNLKYETWAMMEMTEQEQISMEFSPYIFGGLGFCSYSSFILFFPSSPWQQFNNLDVLILPKKKKHQKPKKELLALIESSFKYPVYHFPQMDACLNMMSVQKQTQGIREWIENCNTG